MSEKRESGEEDDSARLRRAWELSQHMLAAKVTKVTFESYIRTTEPISYIDNVITLGVPSQFVREWLEKKSSNAIRSALEFHLDTSDIELRFVITTRDSDKGSASASRTARSSDSAQTELSFDQESISGHIDSLALDELGQSLTKKPLFKSATVRSTLAERPGLSLSGAGGCRPTNIRVAPTHLPGGPC